MRHEDCTECRRLWREYGAVLTEYIRLDGKRRLAILEHDPASIEKLTAEVVAMARTRTTLRETIQQHENDAHGNAANAARGDG